MPKSEQDQEEPGGSWYSVGFFPFNFIWIFAAIFLFIVLIGVFNAAAVFIGVGWLIGLFWVLVIVFILSLLFRSYWWGYSGTHYRSYGMYHRRWHDLGDMAVERAKMRFASGEISEKEYKRIIRVLRKK